MRSKFQSSYHPSCLAGGGTCFLFFSPSFLLALPPWVDAWKVCTGLVVEQAAKFKHSKSSQPADSPKALGRAEGLGKACVCVTACTGELESSKCCL